MMHSPDLLRAALIGDHIGPSLSPAMHEAEGRALGLAYHYDRIDTAELGLDLATALHRARDQGLVGVNVTYPHKQTLMPLLTSLSHRAWTIGAANTVLFIEGVGNENDRFFGENTDTTAFGQALHHRIGAIRDQVVAQFGAGGVGAAVAFALCEAGIRSLLITDADSQKSTALVKRLRTAGYPARTSDTIDLAGVDGAVNCTPVGMATHPGQVFDPTHLPRQAWVADCVYPHETELVRNARAAGLPVMSGTHMALLQMAASFELLTGQAPDIKRMKCRMTALLHERA